MIPMDDINPWFALRKWQALRHVISTWLITIGREWTLSWSHGRGNRCKIQWKWSS